MFSKNYANEDCQILSFCTRDQIKYESLQKQPIQLHNIQLILPFESFFSNESVSSRN